MHCIPGRIIRSAVPPVLKSAGISAFGLPLYAPNACLRPALAVYRFEQAAPECSLRYFPQTALSVGDAVFLSCSLARVSFTAFYYHRNRLYTCIQSIFFLDTTTIETRLQGFFIDWQKLVIMLPWRQIKSIFLIFHYFNSLTQSSKPALWLAIMLIDEDTRNLYRQGISAFGGISLTYRIAFEKDSPVIVWDFHSLLVMVQRCENQFNVYKSREKKKVNKKDDWKQECKYHNRCRR